jgi:hypothetical protein
MGLKSLFPSLLSLTLFGNFLLTMSPKAIAQETTSIQLTAQTSNQLTEDKIRQVMAAIAEAEKSENLEEMLKFLAPFAVSEVTVEHEGKSITTTIEGLEAHRTFLDKTFALVKDRELINDHMRVRISPDGHMAVVTRILVEVINTSDGRQFITSGNDTFRFAWINNQPTIVSTKSQGWIELTPR